MHRAREKSLDWSRCAQRLDRRSPTPLYHQLALALRWEIGLGRVPADAPLPAARAAAKLFGLNFHTVRRAYAELARLGVVDSARRRGTRVRARAKLPRVQASELITAIECNWTQAAEIAREVADECRQPCVPWLLDWPEPPPGPIVTTTFHAGEVRRRFGDRDLHAVALVAHPEMAARVHTTLTVNGRKRVCVIDRDHDSGRSVAAELRRVLGRRGIEETKVAPRDLARWLERERNAVLVVAPRVWDTLPESLRAHPCVLEFRFAIEPARLERFRVALSPGQRTRP